jgi:hypothetical protein
MALEHHKYTNELSVSFPAKSSKLKCASILHRKLTKKGGFEKLVSHQFN